MNGRSRKNNTKCLNFDFTLARIGLSGSGTRARQGLGARPEFILQKTKSRLHRRGGFPLSFLPRKKCGKTHTKHKLDRPRGRGARARARVCRHSPGPSLPLSPRSKFAPATPVQVCPSWVCLVLGGPGLPCPRGFGFALSSGGSVFPSHSARAPLPLGCCAP